MSTFLIRKAITDKWHKIAYGLDVTLGSENCILCQNFRKNDCIGCPIYKHNHKYHKCKNTSCRNVLTMTLLSDNIDMADAVEDFIVFLCSLLPENNEFYESYDEYQIKIRRNSE